jgi:hypothetical protein
MSHTLWYPQARASHGVTHGIALRARFLFCMLKLINKVKIAIFLIGSFKTKTQDSIEKRILRFVE